MTIVKLHYDGWLKLPAGLLRALGAKTGDMVEISPRDGGLVLRAGDGTTGTGAPPRLADPAPAGAAAADTSTPAKRAARRKETPSGDTRASVVALPPALRGRAGRRKARLVERDT